MKREREKERKRERENAQRAEGQNAQISANGKSVRKREMGGETGNGWGNQNRVKKLNAYLSVFYLIDV